MIEVPRGWYISGNNPDDYQIGLDRNVAHSGNASGSIKSKTSRPEGNVTLMQAFKGKDYCGKRLRLSGYVKTKGVEYFAGLWMRIDDKQGQTLSFDNMEDRPIRKTTEWKQYDVVLDVPEETDNIAFGILLEGPGQVWVDDFQFEIVGEDVPTTDMKVIEAPIPETPTNLDFET